MPASLSRNSMKDPGINKFKKTNLFYTTDKYLLYQDPTWLGFKLLFLFDQPDSRLLYRGPDPNVQQTEVEAKAYINTAYAYLKNIGEDVRAKWLGQFVAHLQAINTQTPWFFQTIEGLPDAWKRGYHEDEFKALLPKDRKITINCLESIDLRISALMDLYRKSCFDWKNRRELVPGNLRKFTVYIYVYELRNINRTGKPGPIGLIDIQKELGLPDVNEKQQAENYLLLGKDPFDDGGYKSIAERAKETAAAFKKDPLTAIKDTLTPSGDNQESANTPNPYINRFLFKFGNCEFLPDESSAVFDKVSSVVGAEGEAAQQKLVFTYRDVEEINLYNIWSPDRMITDGAVHLLDQSAFDNPSFTKTAADAAEGGFDMQSVLNKTFGKFGGPLAGGLASLAAEKLERLLASYAGKLLLGNIYGFSAANAAGAVGGILTGDPTQVAQGLGQLGGSILGSKSKKNDTNDQSTLGKVFDRSASIANDFLSVLKSEVTSSTGAESMSNKKISEVSNVVLPGDGKASLTNVDAGTNPGSAFSDPSNSNSNNSQPVSGNAFSDPSNSNSNNSQSASGNAFSDPSNSSSNNSKSASGNVYEPGVSITNNSKPASGNVYE